jgi:hypothetical protein
MSFTAYQGICQDLSIQADPLYGLRAALIIGGLITALLSLASFLREVIERGTQLLDTGMISYTALQISLTLCSLSIGWALFPYWVNGIFQAYQGVGSDYCTLQAYDPDNLMPMIWIGGIWWLGAFFISIFAFGGGVFLFLVTAVLLIKEGGWKHRIPTLICLGIQAAVVYRSRYYMTWLGD